MAPQKLMPSGLAALLFQFDDWALLQELFAMTPNHFVAPLWDLAILLCTQEIVDISNL